MLSKHLTSDSVKPWSENNHEVLSFPSADTILRHWLCLLRFPSALRRLSLPDVSPAKTSLSLRVISHYMTKCWRSCKHPQHLLKVKRVFTRWRQRWKERWERDIGTSKGTQKIPAPSLLWGNIQRRPRMRYCLASRNTLIYQPLSEAHTLHLMFFVIESKYKYWLCALATRTL